MKITALSCLLLLIFFSCKKDRDRKSEPEKPKSTVTATLDGKSFQTEAQLQVQKFGDTAEVRIFSTSSAFKVELHAKSGNHTNGVGDYFLECCNNDFWVRLPSGDVHYEGSRAANGIDQLGFVKITQKDDKGFEGSFSITGKNSDSVAKEVTGVFKILY